MKEMKSSTLSELSWELSVLSRAVIFPNLSAASQQIGVSQPQLSRIIARLEKSLGVVLLNREVRRRATWMPIAHELSQTYSRGARHLEVEMKRLIEDAPLRQLRMGTLEGLIPEDRAILEREVGKGVCGLGKAFGLVGEDNGFNPSAAFVAQQAAALVVGALIRGNSGRPNYVQYDALFGPYGDMTLHRNPRANCRCQTDRNLHGTVRSHRQCPGIGPAT